MKNKLLLFVQNVDGAQGRLFRHPHRGRDDTPLEFRDLFRFSQAALKMVRNLCVGLQ